MPMTCTVCLHEAQEEIARLQLGGTPLRKIAEQYHLSTTALHRHKKHITAALVVAHDAEVVAKADTLLDQVKNLLSQAERLTKRAEHAGSLDTALRGIGQVRGVLELLGEVSGQLAGKGTQVAIGINGGSVQIKAAPPSSLSDEQLEEILHRNGRPLPQLIEGRMEMRNDDKQR